MNNPLLPGPHQLTQQVIRVPYRVEQHQEEQKQDEELLPKEHPKPHDPYWRTRMFSIQHIRDCQEGKQFSWLWTPMTEVFNLAQVMFFILPFAAYFNDRGNYMDLRGLVFMCLSLQMLLAGAKYALRWYHDWRFKHIKYRIVRH